MHAKNQVQKRSSQGFTLIELIFTVAVLAVLLQLGIPSLIHLQSRWQRDLATKMLGADLALARSAAIKNSKRVIMCNSSDGVNCAQSGDRDWKSGWLIFQDLNENGVRDISDTLVSVEQAMPGIKSLKANNRIQRFVFLPNGLMASGMCTLEIVPRSGDIQRITVSRIGRVRLSMAKTVST